MDSPGTTTQVDAAAREVDAVLVELHAGRDVASQQARLERAGAAAVPWLLDHLDGEYGRYALYALQFCWTDAAVEPVARRLTSPELEVRRMAAVLFDRHLGREYLARRCAEHVGHPDPEVAGYCFEQSELMYPDVERARSLFAVPHLRWRLARRLPRYYARTLAAGTRSLVAGDDAEAARAGIVALLHHDDGDPAGHALIVAHLKGDDPKLREAAAEFLAWRANREDLDLLAAIAAGESDPYAHASQVDAIAAIGRRLASGAEVGRGPAIETPLPADPAAAYREAINRLEQDPCKDSFVHARAVSATAEPFEPRLFYTGAPLSEEFVVTRRLRERLMARLLAMPWSESADPQEVAPSGPPPLAERIVAPTRSTLVGEGESYGVFTNEDNRAFKSLVHVGDDVSWQEDHASVLALADGVVRAVRCEASWGHLVIVEHLLDRAVRPGLAEYAGRFARTVNEPVVGPRGEIALCSLYAHLGGFVRVRPGETVRAGQKLGAIGRTLTWENGGYPAHLHLGVHLGPFVQTPRPGSRIDLDFRDRRYAASVLRTGPDFIETTIRYRGDPGYRVNRTRRWECGYVSRWYWDEAVHGWLSPRALLRHTGR